VKIVYVDYNFHYGQKELGLNYIAIDGFIASFLALGHEVIPFFYDDLVNETELLHKRLVNFCEKENPDLIFFILAQDLFKKEVLKQLSENYTTVNFFGDDHWRFESFTKKLAHSFTFCITTDLLSEKKYNDIGVDNVIVSQWAALDITDDSIVDKEYKYDISFVGGKSPYRDWFVSYLRDKGLRVECFGVGWPAGPVSINNMARIFSETKINLNISNSRSYDLRFLCDKPFSFFRQLRSSKASSQIKARNFEIPALNGFQLSEYVPFLNRYLNIGKEIVCFNNIEESVDLIQYYLKNDIEREAIKSASHHRVVNENLYINRVKDILEQIVIH